MTHKAGFVNIIGYPNVGKSTLMNALVGENLSIITSKAQTTRHRIMGIVNGDDFQIVYSDTPGIVRDPAYRLHEFMNQYIDTALQDADIVLLITEPGLRFEENEVIQKLIKTDIPVMVLINKIDLSSQQIVEGEIKYWESRLSPVEVIPISAKESFNIAKVFDLILENLPESPAYFDKDEMTTRSMRFFVSEIIREKIFLNYRKEIPYSVQVIVDSYKEEKSLIRIAATIYVERESQKAIILGHQGKSIKKTASEARIDIEKFTGTKVFLEVTVKANKDWRDNEAMLKRFGYDQ